MPGKAITVRIIGDASGFEKAMAVTAKNSESVTKKIAGTFGGIQLSQLTSKVQGALPGIIDMGRQLESSAAKAQTVFGPQAIGMVDAWATAGANAMGLTRRQAVGMAADFADLLVPMGFTQEQAAKMSTDVVGLSGALANWSGGKVNAAQASEILSKAMLGERDGLKTLGIAISEADVQARLAVKGQDKLTGAALEQAKAVATSELIFEKSKDAQRAFADGQRTSAERAAENAARMREMQETIATKVLPVVDRLVGAGMGLISWFTNLSTTGKVAVGAVAGLGAATFAMVKAVQAGQVAVQAFKTVQEAWAARTKVWTAVQAVWNAVMMANPVVLIIAGLVALGAAFVLAYQRSETFRNVVHGVLGAIAAAGRWLWESVLQPAFNGIAGAFRWLGGVVAGAYGLWKATFFDPLAGAIRWMWNAFQGVADFIGRAFETGINLAKAPINGLIGLINGVIGGIEAIARGVGKIPGTPGFLDSLNLPRIPQLAEGGVVTRPTLALIGEAGPEAVVPLSGRNAGVGGTTVNVTVNVAGSVTSERRLVDAVVAGVEAKLGRGDRIADRRGRELKPT